MSGAGVADVATRAPAGDASMCGALESLLELTWLHGIRRTDKLSEEVGSSSSNDLPHDFSFVTLYSAACLMHECADSGGAGKVHGPSSRQRWGA